MAELVLIYGRSGTGKSTSLRNFKGDEVAVINVMGKRLPFKTDIKPFKSENYAEIENAIKSTQKKAIVIDDFTYLMTQEFMRNIGKSGFQKFNDLAANVHMFVEMCGKELPEDTIVYLLGHSDQADDGREHFKTIGKAVDNYVNIEGLCTIVLKTVVQGKEYFFQTQNNGQDTCKSPMGMFAEMYVPNDLKLVDTTIREFYGMGDLKVKKEK